MFEELSDGGATNDGEEQRMQMQNMQQEKQEFGSEDDMDDFLGDAPMLPEDDIPQDSTEQPRSTKSSSADPKKEEEMEEDEEDEEPIAPTQLGDAIDSLMMHWCQLLTNVSVKAPVPPPSTLDHVKEVAEVCSKRFRDASIDVNNEFTRLGVQWEMEQIREQEKIEATNLDEAIDRQEKLLDAARNLLRTRVETYEREHPNAGKQFTT
uniref:Mediator of RNA polymerase II transcription subunit 28 n=1 Tax=Caenorhabditis tropicalis TaxID=1561998 RepID=A0A1I7UEJ5_9PELO